MFEGGRYGEPEVNLKWVAAAFTLQEREAM